MEVLASAVLPVAIPVAFAAAVGFYVARTVRHERNEKWKQNVWESLNGGPEKEKAIKK